MIMTLLSWVLSIVVVQEVRLVELEERFRNGGDTVYVVNFWATWCKPCIEELPAFDKLDRMQQPRPLRVVLVSLDDPADHASVVKLLQRKGIRAHCVLLNEERPHQWIDNVDSTWTGAIPATLMIDAGRQRRAFFEQTFSFDQLSTTLRTFLETP